MGIIFQVEKNIIYEEISGIENKKLNFKIDSLTINEAVSKENVQPNFENSVNIEEAAENNSLQSNTYAANVGTVGSRKHRRSFDIITHESSKFIKKPKLLECMLPPDALLELNTVNLQSVKHIDFAWILSLYLNLTGIPMWVGYNSLLHEDPSPKHIVCYLTTINDSPTNKETVYETLIQSRKVAAECGQKYIEVTYDLAIAKVALQIKSMESETFKD